MILSCCCSSVCFVIMKAADDFDVTVDDVTNVQTSGTTANVDAIRGTRFATTLRNTTIATFELPTH